MDLEPPARKTIDLEGRIVEDGVRKAIRDRQLALEGLVHAIGEYRKLRNQSRSRFRDRITLMLLNKAIDRAEGILR